MQCNYSETFTEDNGNTLPIDYFVITMGQGERLNNIKLQQEKIRSPLQIFNAVVLEKTPEALML